jgi:hypothetical protein
MTFVSIKYTRRLPGSVQTLKVSVCADVGHGRQDIGKASSAWARQRCGQDLTVLGFSTSAMRSSTLFERSHNTFIDAANQQISHPALQQIER